MRYASAPAFRQALEQRLRDRSRTTGESSVRLRKLVAFERLLARLLLAAPGRWVLKGALALDFRVGSHRTTKDMDLVMRDEATATDDLQRAAALDLGDFFVFSAERVSGSTALTGVPVRFRVRAELAGRVFEEVYVDVGFSDPLGWEPEPARGPDLLSFADLPPPEVPTVSLEQQVAEKVHAYTRTYGGGVPSSRVKDLVDLVLIAQEVELDGARAREALERTFSARAQQPLPASFPPPPAEWRQPYRRLAREVGLQDDVRAAHAVVALLIDPLLRGEPVDRWDPTVRAWR